ncbi:MAG: hypothetical protein AB7O67_16405 [Vicinamibacterales bacterium]
MAERKKTAPRGGDSLVGFAEELGRLLGTAERRATDWLAQRKAVTDSLRTIRNRADALLEQLGDAAEAVGRGRREAASEPAATRGTRRAKGAGSPKASGSSRAGGTAPKRPVSPETRQKLSAAAKKRAAAKKATA